MNKKIIALILIVFLSVSAAVVAAKKDKDNGNSVKRIYKFIEMIEGIAGKNPELDRIKEEADSLEDKKQENSLFKQLIELKNKIRKERDITDDYICPKNYDLKRNTIIFYYTDEPHSDAMMQIIGELEQDYDFYRTDDLWNKKAIKCLDVIGTTPTFVCAGTNEKLVGEVSKEELGAFAEKCSNSETDENQENKINLKKNKKRK